MIKLNSQGVRALLRSQEIYDHIESMTKNVRDKCGDGYESSVVVGKNRVIGSVITATSGAIKDNSNNNTLLKRVKE